MLLAVGTSCGPKRHLPVVTKNMPADEVPTGATPSFFILHGLPYIDTEQATYRIISLTATHYATVRCTCMQNTIPNEPLNDNRLHFARLREKAL